MRISARSDYAIRAMAELAAASPLGDRPVKAEELAQAQDIPVKFLLEILRELRNAVGLRSLAQGPAKQTAKAAKLALPSFKQYREQDGKFYFKLLDADGRLLLQSTGFDAPKEAGQAIAALKRDGLAALAGQHLPVEGVAESEVGAALTALAEAAA